MPWHAQGLALLAALSVAGCGHKYSSLEGEKLTRLYGAVEQLYVSDKKFRTDYDPEDAPYDAVTLTKNFTYVAQNSETQTVSKKVLIKGEAIPLARWNGPLRIWATGATKEDAANLKSLAERVTRLTGLGIERAQNAEDANVYILIANADERREMSGLLSRLGREDDAPMLRAWPDLAEFPCIARVFVEPKTHIIEWSLIFIKAELRGHFRKSCITEEFVQSLGLFNDGPDVRPSIFNDDAEFIELTRHDEYLLRILYDDRLKPGMTAEKAEPIVRQIATELLSEGET